MAHYNDKKIRMDLNGEIKDFESGVAVIAYLGEVYGIGETTVKKIIRSGEPYKPRQHALKVLTGLKLYHI